MPCSRWPRQNEPNGIFGDVLSHSALFGLFFNIIGLFLSVMTSGFMFLWDFCMCLLLFFFLNLLVCFLIRVRSRKDFGWVGR